MATVTPIGPEQLMSDNPIDIRRATTVDAELVASLGARTFLDTFGPDNTEEDMTAYLGSAFGADIQARQMDDPDNIFLIAEVAGAPTGYVRLRVGNAPAAIPGYDRIEIVRFYADRSWLGCGVGPALMVSSLEIAAQLECDTVWLDVWDRNARAIAFYVKWGFAVVGDQEFRLGEDVQHDLLMARAVTTDRTMYSTASRKDLSAVRAILTSNGLPVEDVGEHIEHFTLAKDGPTLLGVAGVEPLGDDGLLRSVCVSSDHRNRGIAGELCRRVESHSRDVGLKRLFLLTETANEYFERRGYTVCPRESVPPAVRDTAEFHSLCPSTAVCLTRSLDNRSFPRAGAARAFDTRSEPASKGGSKNSPE